jgi:hypothetical protein
MTPMKHLMRALLGVAAIVAFTPGSANATAVIDFGTGSGGSGGTIALGADIVGSNIFIDSLIVTGAPTGNGTYDVEGAGVCADVNGGCGLLNFDRNANTISIVGSIPSLGIFAPVILLSGNLSCGVTVVKSDPTTASLTACGTDTKYSGLLLALGIPTNTVFSNFGFVTGVNPANSGSPYTAISTDMTNTAVPDGGSTLGLLGMGMLGLGYLRRRKA